MDALRSWSYLAAAAKHGKILAGDSRSLMTPVSWFSMGILRSNQYGSRIGLEVQVLVKLANISAMWLAAWQPFFSMRTNHCLLLIRCSFPLLHFFVERNSTGCECFISEIGRAILKLVLYTVIRFIYFSMML
jgi:hypothetical protein